MACRGSCSCSGLRYRVGMPALRSVPTGLAHRIQTFLNINTLAPSAEDIPTIDWFPQAPATAATLWNDPTPGELPPLDELDEYFVPSPRRSPTRELGQQLDAVASYPIELAAPAADSICASRRPSSGSSRFSFFRPNSRESKRPSKDARLGSRPASREKVESRPCSREQKATADTLPAEAPSVAPHVAPLEAKNAARPASRERIGLSEFVLRQRPRSRDRQDLTGGTDQEAAPAASNVARPASRERIEVRQRPWSRERREVTGGGELRPSSRGIFGTRPSTVERPPSTHSEMNRPSSRERTGWPWTLERPSTSANTESTRTDARARWQNPYPQTQRLVDQLRLRRAAQGQNPTAMLGVVPDADRPNADAMRVETLSATYHDLLESLGPIPAHAVQEVEASPVVDTHVGAMEGWFELQARPTPEPEGYNVRLWAEADHDAAAYDLEEL